MSSSCLSSSYAATKSVFHFFQKRLLASSNAVGFIHKQESASRNTLELNPNTSNEKHASVINFFKSLGFSDSHVSKIAKRPQVLTADVEKILKPKIECLVDYGFSGSFLHDLIAADPQVLCVSLNSHLLPTLRCLKTYLGSNEKIAAVVKRCPWLLSYGNTEIMEHNFNFLVSEGVPLDSILKLISSRTRILTLRVVRMVHAFKSAKEFGFRPTDPMLVCAMDAILGMSEFTMYRKTEFVKNLLGLSEEQVKSLFKRQPQCFNYSEEKMKNVANFFVNTVRVESSFLPSIPEYFGYSVDKRLVPRYNVYNILESKKLLKKGVKFTSLLKTGEEWFENNYVVKYLDQVPNLMELYRGCSEASNMRSVTATDKAHCKVSQLKC